MGGVCGDFESPPPPFWCDFRGVGERFGGGGFARRGVCPLGLTLVCVPPPQVPLNRGSGAAAAAGAGQAADAVAQRPPQGARQGGAEPRQGEGGAPGAPTPPPPPPKGPHANATPTPAPPPLRRGAGEGNDGGAKSSPAPTLGPLSPARGTPPPPPTLPPLPLPPGGRVPMVPSPRGAWPPLSTPPHPLPPTPPKYGGCLCPAPRRGSSPQRGGPSVPTPPWRLSLVGGFLCPLPSQGRFPPPYCGCIPLVWGKAKPELIAAS